MRLVTFVQGDRAPAAGALIDGDRGVVDLFAARADPRLSSVLAIVPTTTTQSVPVSRA